MERTVAMHFDYGGSRKTHWCASRTEALARAVDRSAEVATNMVVEWAAYRPENENDVERWKMDNKVKTPVVTRFKDVNSLISFILGDYEFPYTYAYHNPTELATCLYRYLKGAEWDEKEDTPAGEQGLVEITPLALAEAIIETGKAEREELRSESEYAASEEADWVRQEMTRRGLDEATIKLNMHYVMTFKRNEKGGKEPLGVIDREATVRVHNNETGAKEVANTIYRFLTEEAIPESINCGLWPDPDYNFWVDIDIRPVHK